MDDNVVDSDKCASLVSDAEIEAEGEVAGEDVVETGRRYGEDLGGQQEG